MDQQTPEIAALQRFESKGEDLALALLSLDKTLLRAVQERLAVHGVLDPPADGFLGPAVTWALLEFSRRADLPFDNALTQALARRLLSDDPVFPLGAGSGFAGRVLAALRRRGDWVCRHPQAVNIVYLEGTRPDGAASPAHPDAFDDLRLLLRIDARGGPELLGAWHATTRSGRAGVDEPVDEKGPPRLEPGQYKAWVMGTTAIGTKLEQEALVQVAELPVRRDVTGDFRRADDPREVGHFVIDQHGSYDAPHDRVWDTAVGCLVARDQAGHTDFMAALRSDPRWRASNAYQFMTSLLTRAELDSVPGG